MIQFSKLRLSGFKSFVDKTELDIGPGLNGIVGPNGCGKSNLVEALRWVMGESSAKRMRGDGMEDVIFAGTDRRSARNIAEVSLLLDNTARQAPSAYNSSDEIEVVRKIEKDKGSGYKINGKNARARDVQMLFADTVTGSNSPSLVSQGHVTRMINAKPNDRRLILEESAGIAGLYARRHEAELRLKAADSNLLRIEDIVSSMESRLNSLKRQSRQAAKYKDLSAQIRQLELVITYLEWRALVEKKKDLKNEFGIAESMVAERLTTVTQLTKTQSTQVEELPPLRKKETEIAATLQKQKLEFQRLEEEIDRYKKDLQEAKTQLHQAEIDKQREEQTLEESGALLEKIESEHQTLLKEEEQDSLVHAEKDAAKNSWRIKVAELEERFTALKESAAESRARESSLQNQIQQSESRLETLLSRKDKALAERSTLVIDENSQKKIQDLEHKTAQYEQNIQLLNDKIEPAKAAISNAEEKTEEERIALSHAQKQQTEVSAEISMLEQFFDSMDEQNFSAVLDQVEAKQGFEKALSRALGDSLMASLDDEAPTYWLQIERAEDLPPLPNDIESLRPYVQAPEALHIALSQIGVVGDKSTGDALVSKLAPGQSLVSREGHYWRWDGLHVQASATDRHSVHLEQKNKLRELEAKRDDVEHALEIAQKNLNDALSAQNGARAEYEALLADIKETEQTLKELRPALLQIKERNVRIESDRKRLDDQVRTLEEDIESLSQSIENDRIAYSAIIENQNEGDHSADVIAEVKAALDDAKEHYQNAVRDYDLLVQAQSTRSARIQAIADERVSLKNRAIRATEHMKTLKQRAQSFKDKLATLEANPIQLDGGQEEKLNMIAELERSRDAAAERLAACEEEVAVTSKALKEAENTLGSAREERARAQAMLAAVNEQLVDMERAIQEKLNLRANQLAHQADVDLVRYQIGDLDKLKAEREQLTRQRDMIGPVNLRAEEEAAELEAEFSGLLHERNDLIQAIEELRGGINKINKEARERLLIAFDHVNAHFKRLFVRLFGGGHAHLELVNSDDPLGAGLEIFAQPPGKALQSLSLLSGGEQTLASIALIFAMFLTNPSPICVLDEIDAPLDDANVDRVCDLLDEIAERGDTRFLVITHHRLSMARMDRLYGVTMAEKGVSQLVSVDLQKSFDFIDKQVA